MVVLAAMVLMEPLWLLEMQMPGSTIRARTYIQTQTPHIDIRTATLFHTRFHNRIRSRSRILILLLIYMGMGMIHTRHQTPRTGVVHTLSVQSRRQWVGEQAINRGHKIRSDE